jgi:hypothetical protein
MIVQVHSAHSAQSVSLGDLKREAPALVVDSHCKQELYPGLWKALREMSLKDGRVIIDADLAIAEIPSAAHGEFLDSCLLPLLREHVRPVLDQAIQQVVQRFDQRLDAELLGTRPEVHEWSQR